jgi:hypothetical protein
MKKRAGKMMVLIAVMMIMAAIGVVISRARR